jgi:hypothetical protein
MGTLAAIVSGVNAANVQADRDRISLDVMRQAKEALIARAALDQTHPGALPCPDLVTNVANNVPNDGRADLLAGNNCPSYVGRLPWATLDLPDVRDDAGERLWYVLSPNFRDSASSVVNSDTQGQLSVVGTSESSRVVALVIAPGPPMGGQVRDLAGANSVVNYLECENANGAPPADLKYADGDTCSTPVLPRTERFNDRILTITEAELFAATEPVVARRIQKEIVPAMLADYALWLATGAPYFPFAAPFPAAVPAVAWSPTPSVFRGVVDTFAGLMPVSTATTMVTFVNAPTAQCYPPTGAPVPATLAFDARSLTCSFTGVATGDRVRVTASAQNVGTAFVRPLDVSGVGLTGTASAALDGSWGAGGLRQAFAADRNTLDIDARVLVGAAGDLTVTLNVPQFGFQTDPATAWFFNNRWQQSTFYAVSPDVTPFGSSWPVGNRTCSTCLGGVGLPTPATTQVALILSGRALDGTPRPVTTLGKYLEAENSSLPPVDWTLAQMPRTSQFNDRVVVVRTN